MTNPKVKPKPKPTKKIPKPKVSSLSDTLVSWAFKPIKFITGFPTAIFNQILTPGTDGATTLGRLSFLFLTVLSSDSYWQVIYQGRPLMPWYETTWTGWGWLPGITFFPITISLGLFANIAWIVCVLVGLTIQCFQSACFNGEKFLGYGGQMIGFVAIATWIFDFFLTFISRNPLRYSEPMDVLGCLAFNIFSIFCAELGRWVEKMLSGHNATT